MNPVHRFFEHKLSPDLIRNYIVKKSFNSPIGRVNLRKLTKIIGLDSVVDGKAKNILVNRNLSSSSADLLPISTRRIWIVSIKTSVFCPVVPRAREEKYCEHCLR